MNLNHPVLVTREKDDVVMVHCALLPAPWALSKDAAFELAMQLLEAYRVGTVTRTPKNEFEQLIRKALLDLLVGHSELIHFSQLRSHGPVNFILTKDLASLAREIDPQIFDSFMSTKADWSLRKITNICRNAFGLKTIRSGSHGGASAVIVDDARIAKLANGLVQE